jgi:hypothetical protein
MPYVCHAFCSIAKDVELSNQNEYWFFWKFSNPLSVTQKQYFENVILFVFKQNMNSEKSIEFYIDDLAYVKISFHSLK